MSVTGLLARAGRYCYGSKYLLRRILVYKPKDLNRDWSPRFSTLRDKNGWIRAKTAWNLNLGVSRNRFCDFLAGPDGRSFSRFHTRIGRSRSTRYQRWTSVFGQACTWCHSFPARRTIHQQTNQGTNERLGVRKVYVYNIYYVLQYIISCMKNNKAPTIIILLCLI